MTETVLARLPTERPPIDLGNSQVPTRFDWPTLVGLTVHPLKVAIIEALSWVGNPLSVGELNQVLADSHYSGYLIGYHVTALMALGVIEVTHVRRVRGAREHYYSLS